MPAMWGAVISGGASLLSGYMGSQGAGDAAAAGEEAAKKSAEMQNAQYWQSRQDQLTAQKQAQKLAQPYQQVGYNALAALQYGLGLGDPTKPIIKNKEAFDPTNYRNWLVSQQVAPENLKGKKKKQYVKYWKDQLAIAKQRGDWASYNALNNAKKLGNVDDSTFWRTQYSLDQEPGAPVKEGQYGFGGYGSLLKKFGIEDFNQEPGYEFRRAEGNRGIESSAAARGGLQSGATLKALNRFNQDYASNEYQNAYNRYVNDQGNVFNRLSGVAGTGQAQTNQMISQNANTIGNINQMASLNAQRQADAMTQAANARMSGYAGQTQAWQNALGGIANAGASYYAQRSRQPNYDTNMYLY